MNALHVGPAEHRGEQDPAAGCAVVIASKRCQRRDAPSPDATNTICRPSGESASGRASRWFSPDGRWVAYQSNESGPDEVYVRPLLHDLNAEGAMMAVPIVTGATLSPGAPVVLFPTRIVGGGVDRGVGRQYDVAPDGRFLINTELPGDSAPITLQHWNPEAKR